MQLTYIFAKLLTLSAAALALPAAEQGTDFDLSNNEVVESVGKHVEHLAALEARDDCSTIATVIDTIGTSREELCFITFGYYTSRAICNNLGWNDCDGVSGAVAATIYGITLLLKRSSGARTAQPGTNVRMRDDLSLAGYLESIMSADGEVFDTVVDLTPTLATRDDNSTSGPVEIAAIHNWDYEGTPVSFEIHDFGDGDGHIILPSNVYDGNATSLSKRTIAAPGFKISYTTRVESKLTTAHRKEMARALANDWASRANSVSRMSNYIGLWKTDSTANFYYRIIPESADFNLNYESVDVCGGMAGYL